MAKNQKQEIKNRSGFTLIELLIVVTIVILLVLFYIPQHRQFARRNELRMAAQEIKEKILQAQAYALAPQHTDLNPNDKNFPYYRFLFYTNDPNGVRYEIKAGAIKYDYELPRVPTAEELEGEIGPIETGYLPKNITVSEQEGTIIFKIPDGDCYYAWVDQTGEKEYVFQNEIGETATIKINLDSCKITTEENF